MRIDLEDALARIDFFETIFQILFVTNYAGYQPMMEHAPTTAINGARRLYQLFKNAVLLSLIRQHTPPAGQRAVKILFDAVSEASLKEAQRTLIHLISYHVKDLKDQRSLLLEAMQYCYSGRSDLVTKPDGSQLLDGLFSTYFRHKSGKERNKHLDILYQNKPLMLQASVAFIGHLFKLSQRRKILYPRHQCQRYSGKMKENSEVGIVGSGNCGSGNYGSRNEGMRNSECEKENGLK